jgi:hypothetical protein
MRLYLLCCALLLSSCGADRIVVTPPPRQVPADLLTACAGYTGPVPSDEGQMSNALVAEVRGRHCSNGKLSAIDEILNAPGPR